MMKATSIILLLTLTFAIHAATSGEQSSTTGNFLVSYSTFYSNSYLSYKLDSSQAFSFQLNDNFQWIQTTSENPHWWTAVITQGGRAGVSQWVTRFRVSYTRDGNIWRWVDGGRQFIGNYDRNTKVRNNFDKPVYGKAIRIHPTAFNNWSALRFDAIYQ